MAKEKDSNKDTITTNMEAKAKGKHATNACYRCGQPGRMAKECRVTIYNCDTCNFDTNDQTDGWCNHARYAATNWSIRIRHRHNGWRYRSEQHPSATHRVQHTGHPCGDGQRRGYHGVQCNFQYNNLNREQDLRLLGNRWAHPVTLAGFSVTRLVKQGFQLTLDDNPRQQRNKGSPVCFCSSYRQKSQHCQKKQSCIQHSRCMARLLAVQHKR